MRLQEGKGSFACSERRQGRSPRHILHPRYTGCLSAAAFPSELAGFAGEGASLTEVLKPGQHQTNTGTATSEVLEQPFSLLRFPSSQRSAPGGQHQHRASCSWPLVSEQHAAAASSPATLNSAAHPNSTRPGARGLSYRREAPALTSHPHTQLPSTSSASCTAPLSGICSLLCSPRSHFALNAEPGEP